MALTMHSNPVVEVLARRQLHHIPQVDARAEGRLSLLVEGVLEGSRLKLLLGPEGLKQRLSSGRLQLRRNGGHEHLAGRGVG